MKPKPATATKPKAKVVAKPVKVRAVVAGKAPKNGVKSTSSKPAAPVKTPKVVPPVQSKSSMPKPIAKPVPTVVSKPQAKPVVGTKATDLTHKPTVSTGSTIAKSVTPVKPKPTIMPARPMPETKMKPIEKMSDKKDFRPATNTIAAPEEPHKTRYSDKELEEFDQLIDQKLIVAREQLEFYLKQLEDMAENPDNKIKGLDDGLSSLESERVSSLASRQQKLIQHLENAKIRIKNKVYGICRETGKLISKKDFARFRMQPYLSKRSRLNTNQECPGAHTRSC